MDKFMNELINILFIIPFSKQTQTNYQTIKENDYHYLVDDMVSLQNYTFLYVNLIIETYSLYKTFFDKQ